MERISVRSGVCHGKPCIAGTRVMVQQVLDLIEAGKGFAAIRQNYFPDIADDDIRASVRFARQRLSDFGDTVRCQADKGVILLGIRPELQSCLIVIDRRSL